MRRIALALSAVATLSPIMAVAETVGPLLSMPNHGQPPAHCTRPDRLKVDGQPMAGTQRLGDLPPADQIKTVYREMNGCPAPLVVRSGVGASGLARPRG